MTLIEEIRKPFNLLTLFLGLAGTVFGVYSYYVPRTEKAISYVLSGPSLIYDAKSISPKLRLIESNGVPVVADTYLVSFTLWNSGIRPIENPDIRRPVSVVFNGVEKIYDYKIVNATDQDVARYTLKMPSGIKNVIELGWEHFDPRKAVSFQVIFSQTNRPTIGLSSDIVGVGDLKPGLPRNVSLKSDYILSLIIMPFAFVLFLGCRDLLRSSKATISGKIFGFLLGIGGIAVIGFAAWVAWRAFSMPQCPI